MKFEFNQNDPLLAQARTVYHDIQTGKLTGQEGFSKLLGLYAGSQVASTQEVQTARNAEIAKLGATGPARVDAVTTVFKATLGDAEGAQLASRLFTAKDVEIAEKLVARLVSQGAAGPRSGSREAPQAPGTKSPEEVARMTPAQRLDYSRQFPQDRMPEWRDPRAA